MGIVCFITFLFKKSELTEVLEITGLEKVVSTFAPPTMRGEVGSHSTIYKRWSNG